MGITTMANNNSYIYNEQATWTLDWVNVTFTVSNPISQIESLRVGYVEYTSFTYSGNTIILDDAPTVLNGWVYVDYFYDSSSNEFSAINLIYDEVLSGVADWINKTFIAVYPVDMIDELRVWGVVYTNFYTSWRYVILNDAPSSLDWAPHLDYYRKDAQISTIDSWVTLAQLRSSIYVRIWQTVTSLQFPKELADEYISEWVKRISKMKRDKTKRWVLSFHKAYDWIIEWTNGLILDVGSVSRYLPAKGIGIIRWWDVVYYNNKTTSSITSISDLDIDLVSWLKIQYGYKLPRNIEKVSEVFINWFKLTPSDFAEYRAHKAIDKFTVYNWYLFLPYRTTDAEIVTVVYTCAHNSQYWDNDIIDFDGDYLPVIKTFALWNMYHDREDDRMQKEEARYKELLKEYKREISKQFENTSWVFQTSWPLNHV